MTTTIYFDLDDTLVEYDGANASVSPERRERFARIGEEPLEHFRERYFGYRTVEECDPFEQAARETVLEFDLDADPDQLARDMFAFATRAGTVAETTTELLGVLRDEYRLGILTNGHRVEQVEKLTHHGLDEYFETVLAASDVGALKPDPRTFEQAKAALPGDEYVYVGDDAATDLPAGDHGFRTAILADSPVPEADLVLTELTELETMLD